MSVINVNKNNFPNIPKLRMPRRLEKAPEPPFPTAFFRKIGSTKNAPFYGLILLQHLVSIKANHFFIFSQMLSAYILHFFKHRGSFCRLRHKDGFFWPLRSNKTGTVFRCSQKILRSGRLIYTTRCGFVTLSRKRPEKQGIIKPQLNERKFSTCPSSMSIKIISPTQTSTSGISSVTSF